VGIYVGGTDCFGLIYTPEVADYTIRALQDFREEVGIPIDYCMENNVIASASNVDIDYVGKSAPTTN